MSQNYIFSQVTATDRAGVVWVAAILSLMFTVITLGTRFQIKWRSLGLDDWLLAASNTVALGQYITIYSGLSNGVGVSSTLLEEQHAKSLGRTVLASEILYLIALGLCKMSVVFFTKRLFTRDHKRAWVACNVALALSALWTIGSVLAVSIGCDGSRAIYGAERCSGEVCLSGAQTCSSRMLTSFIASTMDNHQHSRWCPRTLICRIVSNSRLAFTDDHVHQGYSCVCLRFPTGLQCFGILVRYMDWHVRALV